jgi:hypothetical protein
MMRSAWWGYLVVLLVMQVPLGGGVASLAALFIPIQSSPTPLYREHNRRPSIAKGVGTAIGCWP